MTKEKALKWRIPEYPQYERGKMWYIISAIIVALLLVYAVISGNFLFSVILIIGGLISLITSWKKPDIIEFKMTKYEVRLGDVVYKWDQFQSYWIVDEDGQNNLGLDLKNWLKTDLYIPIKRYSLKDIERFVSKKLPKNKERNEEPFSYFMGRKFKI